VRGKNLVSNFLDHTAPAADAEASAPRLSMDRARATWIVTLADAGVPVSVLTAAAGIESLHAVTRLLAYLQPVEPATAAGWLRGHA
jgi:hypothetical protein